jgi:hypothetical protein
VCPVLSVNGEVSQQVRMEMLRGTALSKWLLQFVSLEMNELTFQISETLYIFRHHRVIGHLIKETPWGPSLLDISLRSTCTGTLRGHRY